MSAHEALDVLAAPDPLSTLVGAAPDDLVALRTAGTGGRPRTVMRTLRSWTDSYPHVSALTGTTDSSRVWVPGPITATMNLFALAHAVGAGASRAPDPTVATHAHLTPSALRRHLAEDPRRLTGLHVVVAGDALATELRHRAEDVGVRVSHYYGSAELSFVAWGEDAASLRPFPGVEVACRDGELWVRSPYVCTGYAESRYRLRRDPDGWTTVGDRGEVTLDDRGVRVTVRGRAGGATTGGATVLFGDIEHTLARNAAGEVVVVALPHHDLGEVVAAVVTRADDVDRLRALGRRALSPAQRPRRWFVLDRLPLTHAGKVDRAAVVRMVTRKERERCRPCR